MFLENVKLALSAIGINKMRSFLTMLGMIIGISSVIAITAIGSSIQGVVNRQFESIGRSAIYFYVNWSMVDDYVPSEALFSVDELQELKKRFEGELVYADPDVYVTSPVRVGNAEKKIRLDGVDAGYENFADVDIIYGRMINENDVKGARPRIVLEVNSARRLFGTENAVGGQVELVIDGEAVDFTVVGVYREKETIFNQISTSDDLYAYIPYSTAPEEADPTLYIYVFLAPDVDVAETALRITDWLAQMKGMPEGYYVYESALEQQNMINDMLGVVSVAIGIIAGISLLVGGIGIMNIMLVSVTERTREIGIRKSLGARTGDILMQFLTESMIISALGGLIGTVLGVGIAAIGMTVAGVGFTMNPLVIVIAVGFSAIVGMFFGIYPARRAAKLDPIEALRYE